jgi:hypothetical protein
MAISDEDRARRTNDYIDTDPTREANPVTMVSVLLVGFVLAVFVGWYVFGKDPSGSASSARTSPPASSTPTTGPNTTTVPKQP